jgi:hypothetical protein
MVPEQLGCVGVGQVARHVRIGQDRLFIGGHLPFLRLDVLQPWTFGPVAPSV